MKSIFITIISIIFFMGNGYTQTKQIAHKSHSGSAASFNLDAPDNFGIVIRILSDSIIKINDSTAVERIQQTFSHTTLVDTLRSAIFAQITNEQKDSINKRREVPVVFVGFDAATIRKNSSKNVQKKSYTLLPLFPSPRMTLFMIALGFLAIVLYNFLPKEQLVK